MKTLLKIIEEREKASSEEILPRTHIVSAYGMGVRKEVGDALKEVGDKLEQNIFNFSRQTSILILEAVMEEVESYKLLEVAGHLERVVQKQFYNNALEKVKSSLQEIINKLK